MKKLKLYIDTSVLGGLFDAEDTARVNTAKGLISAVKNNSYEGFISFLTLEEISKAPPEIMNHLKDVIRDAQVTVLEENEDCIELADAYIKSGAIPTKYRDDARHIAIGVHHDIDFIVSWNYKHMVNIQVKRLITSVNLKMGYGPIEIVPPEEVAGYGEMEI
jgi:predicted nucleic acid-binding protein